MNELHFLWLELEKKQIATEDDTISISKLMDCIYRAEKAKEEYDTNIVNERLTSLGD